MGNIHTSGEDYLETILVLWNKQNGEVRSIDVARELNVTKPSVSNAMKILREGKFITMDENGFITLTDAGRYVAEKIYENGGGRRVELANTLYGAISENG